MPTLFETLIKPILVKPCSEIDTPAFRIEDEEHQAKREDEISFHRSNLN